MERSDVRFGRPNHHLTASNPPLSKNQNQSINQQWLAYGGERSGRFQGLTNKDGSAKTECGIHSK